VVDWNVPVVVWTLLLQLHQLAVLWLPLSLRVLSADQWCCWLGEPFGTASASFVGHSLAWQESDPAAFSAAQVFCVQQSMSCVAPFLHLFSPFHSLDNTSKISSEISGCAAVYFLSLLSMGPTIRGKY